MKKLYLYQMAAVAAVFLLASAPAPAQTFKSITQFGETNGAVPAGVLIMGKDGSLYGTTQSGGAVESGTLFRASTTGTLTTIHNFCSKASCADGSLPMGGVVLGSDGNLYGTTYGGGAHGQGTVFKFATGGAFTTIYSFCAQSNCTDGSSPHAGLFQASDGNLYGTTLAGGSANSGTVFKITTSGTLTTLYSFCSDANCTDGLSPEGGIIQGSDGNFYGTTSQGGLAGSGGTVFQLTSSGVLTTLYTFCSLANCRDGSAPYASLASGSDGNFYGTTSSGGRGTKGTAFKITPSGQLTTLYSFCIQTNCTDGEYPYAGLALGADGNFYGATQAGGAKSNVTTCPFGCGTYYQLTPTGTLNILYNFCSSLNCTDGAGPIAGVGLGTDGNFYGSTSYGGACTSRIEGCGTLYSWSPNVALPPTFVPTSVSFPSQTEGIASTPRSVSIQNPNTGSATLDISSITLTGNNDFVISANTCGTTLLAGRACKVSITYTPSVVGSESASLNVADNAPGSPQIVPVSGTSVAQVVVTPSSLTFPAIKVGKTSGSKNVNIKNNLPTTLTGISYQTAAPFAVASSTCGSTLASKGTCTLGITFSPTVKGTVNGTLTIKFNADNSPQVVTLSGTGN